MKLPPITDRRWDYIMGALVVTWPPMLAIGITLLLAGLPFAWFFIMYCVTSSWGIGMAAYYMLRHGIHGDRW